MVQLQHAENRRGISDLGLRSLGHFEWDSNSSCRSFDGNDPDQVNVVVLMAQDLRSQLDAKAARFLTDAARPAAVRAVCDMRVRFRPFPPSA